MAFDDHPARTVRTDGHRIHVRIAGDDGPLVLLCHGFPESAYSWRHQMAALAGAGYRAAAMDMRGYGRSSKPTGPGAYTISELVADCVGVVEALGDTTAVIVGHDFGAPVAWTAAWTRPDVFRAVAGLSLPFAGRGLAGLPGDPLGDRRPSEVHRELAGPGAMFYQDYFSLPGDVALREIEADLRGWLTSGLFSLSASAPVPPELAGIDLTTLPAEFIVGFVRASMCVPDGGRFVDTLVQPETLPPWLTAADLEHLVAQLEQTGLRAPLRWYADADASWEALADVAGEPLTVPALFIGGDRDVATVWSQAARLRMPEHVKDLRGSEIVADCGHWIQQEHPETVNRLLLEFLGGL